MLWAGGGPGMTWKADAWGLHARASLKRRKPEPQSSDLACSGRFMFTETKRSQRVMNGAVVQAAGSLGRCPIDGTK